MIIPSFLFNKHFLALAGVVAAVLFATLIHHRAVIEAEDRGYERGLKDERLVWQVRENEELNLKNALIFELQEKYRALEQKSATDVANATRKLEEGVARAEADRDHFVAGVRSGAIRVRVPAATTCEGTGGNPTAEARSTAGAAPGAASCELSKQVAEDLFNLAADADRVVHERNALLDIAQKDREVCK